jgi:hypothetical protein
VSSLTTRARRPTAPDLAPAVLAILGAQTREGAIPWFEGGPWDAWNHAECLMALIMADEREAVERGFAFLCRAQEPSGAWLCDYGNALPMDGRDRIARVAAPRVRDTNFAAYPATALWAHWRAYGDRGFVGAVWPTVRAALDFVLGQQHPQGDISWCGEAHGGVADDALIAGCASIFSSLGHGLALAEIVGDPQPEWAWARARLREAMLARPARFDRARTRTGFAMDWYYPVLAGVLGAPSGAARIDASLERFVETGRGCRCVASEPWATVAESAELAMTLVRLGRRAEASRLLDWQDAHRDCDGVWWMGWQFAEAIPWPLEKPTWTQAAMILAREAVHETTPGWDVLVAG